MQEVHLIVSDADFARLMSLSPPPELRAELERAIVVPRESILGGVVTMGARVRYVESESGASRDIELVYPDEADAAQGKVSVLAPVGAALLGLTVGQQIAWDFPDGRPRHLTVVEVTPPARH